MSGGDSYSLGHNDLLLIRADASSEIGTGHIMRCLALAQAWKVRGGTATFLSYCESDTLHRRIIDEGFDFITIEKSHPDPSDLQSTLDILRQFTRRDSSLVTRHLSLSNLWLVIDGYHFDTSYQKAITEAGYRLLVIDDMAHLPNYHADILLNQNLNDEKLSYPCDADTKLLLGTRYALLRQEFLAWRDWKREIPEIAHKILITMGGSDSKNVTFNVIQALNQVDVEGLDVRIVVGPSNPSLEQIENALHLSPFIFELLHSVNNMTELMTWTDIAISGGGSTCWEMAYMGLPNLVIVLADNQRLVAEGLDKKGCSKNLGFHDELTYEKIAEEIDDLMNNKASRKAMSKVGRHLIDGLGVERILNELVQSDSNKVSNSII